MIRFLNLKNQIGEGVYHFAFFDTVTDEICSFNGQQKFETISEFKRMFCEEHNGRPIKRFLDLIPKDFFETSSQ